MFQTFERGRVQRAFSLLDKVNDGEPVNNFDMAFLNNIFFETRALIPLFDRHEEYQGIASQILELYEDIASKALENEMSLDGQT
jgi:hypothetical protein